MKRVTLYSSSRSSNTGRATPPNYPDQLKRPDQTRESFSAQASDQPPRLRFRKFYARHKRLLWVSTAGLLALFLVYAHTALTPPPRQITQEDIRAAVLHTLETNILPSPARKAYEVIRPSIVRVRGLAPDKAGGEDTEKSVGTGVVIVDKGTIFTLCSAPSGYRWFLPMGSNPTLRSPECGRSMIWPCFRRKRFPTTFLPPPCDPPQISPWATRSLPWAFRSASALR